MSTLTERVAAGAAILDEHDPGWWKPDADRAIDLELLDIGETDMCVLGQRCPLEVLAAEVGHDVGDLSRTHFQDAYYAYSVHLSRLGDTERIQWAHAHGFTLAGETGGWDEPDCWDDLTGEWKRVITDRRAAVRLSEREAAATAGLRGTE